MHIYFSGIGGVGLGPLAEIAQQAGYVVSGSDTTSSLMTQELQQNGIVISLNQSAQHIQEVHRQTPIDWLVFTAAVDETHPEVAFAASHNIKYSKRDALLAYLINEKNLSLIAVAGTHGKTTTTAMLVWALQKLSTAISYSIGSQLSFGPSGKYEPHSQFFVYECDEFDRNFLHFSPDYSLITSYDYDHPDTYQTPQEYQKAFQQFITQSKNTIAYDDDIQDIFGNSVVPDSVETIAKDEYRSGLSLTGEHNRHNAQLVIRLLEKITKSIEPKQYTKALNSFPGTRRRFEKLAENIYSDYAHHPVEIAATIQAAREISKRIVVIYQPHQNIRQHHIQEAYKTCFNGAEMVYWLPTYLSREDTKTSLILSPAELTKDITNTHIVLSKLNNALWQTIQELQADNYLIICMGAGSVDDWLRVQLTSSSNL